MAAVELPASGDEMPAPATLGYEQARDELADVVRRLEAGGASLEDSLALWERGEELAAICQQRLDGARERLARADNQSSEHRAQRGADLSGDAVGGSS